MFLKNKNLRKKALAIVSGKVVSLIWAIIVVLLLVAALETWRGEPYENGFYYAFVYGCALWAILSLLSLDSVNLLFVSLTGKLKLPGKAIFGIYKMADSAVLGPANLINKFIKLR